MMKVTICFVMIFLQDTPEAAKQTKLEEISSFYLPKEDQTLILQYNENHNKTLVVNDTLGINDLTTDQLRSLCMKMPSQSQLWSTICEGILSVAVGLFGLIGNIATIFVLTRPSFRETFHKLLICLACFDSLFIISALMIYAIRAHALHLYGASFIHFCFLGFYPMANLSLYVSIYLTLAVSIERFLGLVYPVKSRTRPRRQLCAYLLPVIGFSVLFNIPKAMEFRLFNVLDDENNTSIEVGESEWARDKYYNQYYKVWSNLILTAVIPLSVLIFCNTGIFIVLRKNSKEMVKARQLPKANQLHAHNQVSLTSQSSTNPHSNDNSLALILAGIVFVFIICHGFRFFLAFYQVSMVEHTDECMEHGLQSPKPAWLYIISALNHLMLMINSSVNFIIYCAVGSRFRRALARSVYSLCHKKEAQRSFNGYPKTPPSNLNYSSKNPRKKVLSVKVQKRGHFVIQKRPELEARSTIDTFPEEPKPASKTSSFDENPKELWIGYVSPDGKEAHSHTMTNNSKSDVLETSRKWMKVTAEINSELSSSTKSMTKLSETKKIILKNKVCKDSTGRRYLRHFHADITVDQTYTSSNF